MSAWTGCSNGCGAGLKYRTVVCKDKNGNTVGDTYCSGAGAKPATQQACQGVTSCGYSWAIGGWSACSDPVNGGYQTRDVYCRRTDGTIVADAYCGAKPNNIQVCSGVPQERYNFTIGWADPQFLFDDMAAALVGGASWGLLSSEITIYKLGTFSALRRYNGKPTIWITQSYVESDGIIHPVLNGSVSGQKFSATFLEMVYGFGWYHSAVYVIPESIYSYMDARKGQTLKFDLKNQ